MIESAHLVLDAESRRVASNPTQLAAIREGQLRITGFYAIRIILSVLPPHVPRKLASLACGLVVAHPDTSGELLFTCGSGCRTYSNVEPEYGGRMQQSEQLQQQRPLVSVVMIFLNEERFIEEAIETILAQSYPRWELLLVDDGSTDQSTAVARSYADRHKDNITYLSHPNNENRGMSASRNLGIRHSRGEFVAFLDADDVWFSYTLARQAAAMRSTPWGRADSRSN